MSYLKKDAYGKDRTSILFLFMLSGDPVEIKKPFPTGNGIKFKMEAWMGFEPIHRGFANRSLNPLSTTPEELLFSCYVI